MCRRRKDRRQGWCPNFWIKDDNIIHQEKYSRRSTRIQEEVTEFAFGYDELNCLQDADLPGGENLSCGEFWKALSAQR
jgi:hypothetical protein